MFGQRRWLRAWNSLHSLYSNYAKSFPIESQINTRFVLFFLKVGKQQFAKCTKMSKMFINLAFFTSSLNNVEVILGAKMV